MVVVIVWTDSPNYTPVAGDVGANLYCKVTATNSVGSANANSNTVGPVEAAASSDAFTLIASTVANTLDGSTFASSPIDTTGADLIVVGVACSPGSEPIITDSKGNTWIQLTSYTGGVRSVIWYSRPTSVGSGHIFTATGPSTYASITIAAFSGSVALPFDAQNGATGTGAVASASSGITPSQNDSLVVANVATDTVTPSSIGGGFTALAAIPAGSYYNNRLAYLIQTTAALADPDWSLSGSN